MNGRTERSRTRTRRAGYTLIDVMLVTLVIAVLSTLGLNQYNKYIARAKRPESIVAFRTIAAQQREYMLTHGKYAGTFSALGFNVEGGAMVSPGDYIIEVNVSGRPLRKSLRIR